MESFYFALAFLMALGISVAGFATSSVGSADTFPSRGRLFAQLKSEKRLTETLCAEKSTGRKTALPFAFPLGGRWVAGRRRRAG